MHIMTQTRVHHTFQLGVMRALAITVGPAQLTLYSHFGGRRGCCAWLGWAITARRIPRVHQFHSWVRDALCADRGAAHLRTYFREKDLLTTIFKIPVENSLMFEVLILRYFSCCDIREFHTF